MDASSDYSCVMTVIFSFRKPMKIKWFVTCSYFTETSVQKLCSSTVVNNNECFLTTLNYIFGGYTAADKMLIIPAQQAYINLIGQK